MRPIIFGIALLFLKTSFANTYYISTTAGRDTYTSIEAQNENTPWRTIEKLNAFVNIKPGDSILFKKGDVFYGSLKILSSGTIANRIVFSSYGIGRNPVISGFTTVSSWTSFKGDIYYASIDAVNLNMVTVNGIVQAMGRFPNTGYLKYESHSNNNSITDNDLSGSNSWVGAEVVIRKYRWIIDRHLVTSHVGRTLNYNALRNYGNNSAYSPVDGNGYFVQNHINTIDEFREWYYDPSTKRLYMNFAGQNPDDYVVKASTQQNNSALSTKSNISFSNIDFEGGNTMGVSMINCQYITFSYCNFSYQGGIGIYGGTLDHITVENSSINNSLSNGIMFEYEANNCTINNVSIANTNKIPGSGRSGDGVGNGVSITGNNTIITNNKVTSSGYNGIHFTGNDVHVERNYIDSFCLVKDDGGGIYTFTGDASIVNKGRTIKNNIILNAIGAFSGAESFDYEAFGKAAGIYLDDFANNTEVSNNTLANGEWGGIFLHNTYNNAILNNTVYNFASQLEINQSNAVTRNVTVTGNKFIACKPSQNVFVYKTYQKDNPSLTGTLNSNYYARPIEDNSTILINKDYSGGGGAVLMSLSKWQSTYQQDAISKRSPKTIIDVNDLKFVFNESSSNKTISLPGKYIDVTGVVYNGLIILEPYTSAVLIKDADTAVSKYNAPIYRINSGGKQLSTLTGIFYDDNYFASSQMDTFCETSPITGTSDHSLYQTERNSSTLKLSYNFPVPPGKYTAILHFAEIYHTEVAKRVFDVSIEGSKVLDDYDIFKKVGGFTATTETFEVNVTDSLLNIDFSSLASDGGRDRPKISAIEIISHSENQSPTAHASGDNTITLPVSSASLNGAGSDEDGTVCSYQWSQISGPNTAVFSNSTSANCTVSGLTSGSYVFNLVVRDNGYFPSTGDQFTMTVNPTSETGTPIYRINAGGSQVAHSKGLFYADANYLPSPGDIFSTTTAIAGTNDDAIYQSERSGSTGQFGYSFPVSNGSYTVVLHFAEIYFTGVGNRVFDVTMEGTKVLDDYDIVKKVGSFTATTETFGVTVTDGILNIDFNSLAAVGGRDRAKVSAIEILSNSINQSPSASAGNDLAITWPVNSTVLSGSGSDADGNIDSYMWSQVSGPNNAVFSSNTVANPSIRGLIPGTYVFNLVVKDNEQFPSMADGITVTVNPLQVTGTPVFRINSGGGPLTNSKGAFVADTYYSPIPGDNFTTSAAIAGTLDDAIYQSERSGSTGTFNYSLPVQNGQYVVVLHFAEIYFTAPSNRVFDVSIEGTKVLDNYDIVKKVGSFTATTEVFAVNVSDGLLNINFSSLASDGGQDRPKVSAIEVLRTSVTQSTINGNMALEVVSSPEITPKLVATVSPNPSDNFFNLSLSGSSAPVEIKVFNVAGQVMETKQNLTPGITLRIGDSYLPGLYYAIVRQAGKQVMLRFIKQHQ